MNEPVPASIFATSALWPWQVYKAVAPVLLSVVKISAPASRSKRTMPWSTAIIKAVSPVLWLRALAFAPI